MKYHLTAIAFDAEKKLFWLLVMFAILFVAAYVYFICVSVVNIVLRKEASVEMTAVNSHIGNLEGAYLQKKNALDRQYALDHGFADVTVKTFAAKASDGRGLSMEH